MEIIHLILGKANPNRLNGVNKVVYQLATEQTISGKNVCVWGITKDTQHNYPERNFKTELFQASRNPFRIPEDLKSKILKNKNAIYHLHGGWIPVYSSLAAFFQKNKIKYVLTPHGAYNTVAMKRNSLVKKLYFHLFEKKLLKHVKTVHSIGKSEVIGLNKMLPKLNSIVLPYGFEMTHKSNLEMNSNEFIIGFLGRLDVYTKGLDLLLDAFNVFVKKYPKSKLWLIGDGSGKTFIEKYIQVNSIPNVILWDKKFGVEKDELIQKMTIFAHPSRNEGLPTSVLEAASFGIPSIVTEATNFTTYVDKYKSGISIHDESVFELYLAMCNFKLMAESNQIKEYKLNCIKMLEEEFEWSKVVKNFEQLYV